MHPYLVRLGIPLTVQDFFESYWRTDANGALLFDYGDQQEHYGLGFHRLPISESCWVAGKVDLGINHVFICACAMEAISFLALNSYRLPGFDRLLFMATGGSLTAEKLNLICCVANTKISVIHEHSLLGHLTALKTGAGIRRQPVKAYTLPDNRVRIIFRNQSYDFDEEPFSLSGFEKASGFRFHIRCERPQNHLTYLDQLKAGPFIPNL
jgi:hypothetical protein